MRLRQILALPLLLSLTPIASGQGREEVKANYTKFEYRIPMRDGVKLFTSLYIPKDTSKTYPIMMSRTPYTVAPYGVDKSKSELGPSTLFGKSGYIFAYQDVRGRWMSEGEFVHMRPHNPSKSGPQEIDESTDTYDTIEWLIKNIKGNNGRVGMWGISYPGFYTAAGMIDAHPALKACSPQAPVTDWFVGDDWHHNGAFQLPHAFNFLANFGRPRPVPTSKAPTPFEHGTADGYKFFLELGPIANADSKFLKGDIAYWSELLQHGSYDDYWKARNIRAHLNKISPAVMTVGGWFDAENLFGALECYKKVEATSPNTQNTLVMGPWFHGGWSRGDGLGLGDVTFDSKTAKFYRENIEFPFFEFHLKGQGKADLPEAYVFETGTNRWVKHETWPPKAVKKTAYYMQVGGKLGTETPTDANPKARDDYPSDPAKPVPYQDEIAIGMTKEYMVGDQRFASRRPDVLVYQTEPLESDITIAGPILANLQVSTSGTDSDWVVKVIDVYPDDYPNPPQNPKRVKMGGYQQLVRGDIMRGKFRKDLSKAEPFTPDEPTEVKLTLHDSYHTFRSGHRIMVQIQSSWFPLFDRNPQTFTDIYTATESDFVKATQRVYRSKDLATHLVLPILP